LFLIWSRTRSLQLARVSLVLTTQQALSETELIMEGVSGSLKVKHADEANLQESGSSIYNGVLGKRSAEMCRDAEKKEISRGLEVVKDGTKISTRCSKMPEFSKELQPLLLPPLRYVEGNQSPSPASPKALPSLSSFSRLEKLASAASRMQQHEVLSFSPASSAGEKENR